MRMWGIEDNRAIASDMVREQDFILQVRRLHRLATYSFIINVILSGVKPEDIGKIETAQDRLKAFSHELKASYAEMSNGDVFIVCAEPEQAAQKDLIVKGAGALALAEGKRGKWEDLKDTLIKTYHIPADYAPLRERLNEYVEISRNAAAQGGEETPEQLLNGPAAHGPLTSWSVNQIQNLLDKIKLREFIHAQTVYEHHKDGKWTPLLEEHSIGLEALKQKHFPKLDLSGQNHLFLELCETLDQHLLTELARDVTPLLGHRIHFNLSVHSVMSSVFAQFAHEVPRAEHAKIGFELHRGDLFQNFAATLSAIETLRHEGFKVTLDDITPDMLAFLNLNRFDVDFLKVNASRLYAAQLDSAAVREAFKSLALDRVIFFHCDSDHALTSGLEIGVTKFQGWLIDDKIKKG